MLDDDTYLVKPSLRAVLSQLDPARPKYVGNAVGNYKGRFAHGGSAIILSRPAVARLFGTPGASGRAEARAKLADVGMGDLMLALALAQVGVYLDEQCSHYFSGEAPWAARLREDRLCSPVVSFHGLADSAMMHEVGDSFRRLEKPTRWGEVWRLYGAPKKDMLARTAVERDKDHVGRIDQEAIVVLGMASADQCRQACVGQHEKTCLAWAWDPTDAWCHASPWLVVGREAPGRWTGLNTARIQRRLAICDKDVAM